MRIALIASPRKAHQVHAMTSIGYGFAAHGHTPQMFSTLANVTKADMVVTWGARNATHLPRLILEAGYINGNSGDYVADRLRFISTSWLQPHGASKIYGEIDRKRWKSLGIDLEDWKEGGDYALILEQHPNDANSPPATDWANYVAAVDKVAPIRIRPHPLIEKSGTLESDLAGAQFAVTWASTAAVQAVISGIPVYALSEQAIVRPVAAHSLAEAPKTPNRYHWACELACRQWTPQELASGEFLEGIGWPEGLGTA